MKRFRVLLAVLGVLMIVNAVDTVIGIENSNQIRATQGRLLISEKASTATRVVTVTQRCELTRLVLDSQVNQGHATSTVVDALKVSYAGCEKQLAQVIRINAATPQP